MNFRISRLYSGEGPSSVASRCDHRRLPPAARLVEFRQCNEPKGQFIYEHSRDGRVPAATLKPSARPAR
jgi:hypothetical protein